MVSAWRRPQPAVPGDQSSIQTKEQFAWLKKHVDEGKGRAKEAAGSLTGDRSLKNEGKADQGKATVKDKIDKVADALTARDKK
jgi:uncharacterized protein YjbJ (UPF0337 family)